MALGLGQCLRKKAVPSDSDENKDAALRFDGKLIGAYLDPRHLPRRLQPQLCVRPLAVLRPRSESRKTMSRAAFYPRSALNMARDVNQVLNLIGLCQQVEKYMSEDAIMIIGVVCVIRNDACWSQIEQEQVPKLGDYHTVANGFGRDGEEVLKISAKTDVGVPVLLGVLARSRRRIQERRRGRIDKV